MPVIRTLCLAALIALCGHAYAADIEDVAGEWRTVRHSADIRIEDCGDGTPCGFLAAVGDDVRGGAARDERNRNRALRDRPLEGLPILWGYRPNAAGWTSGKLYNPETGQTFRSSLVVVSSKELRVKGCLGPFCREQVWTRIGERDGEVMERASHG